MKFTVRDLLAVVTIVALALGWVLDNWRLWGMPEENRALRAQVELLTATLEQNGYGVTLDKAGNVWLEEP